MSQGLQKIKFTFAVLFVFLLTACGAGSSIFPSTPTTTDTAALELPNPITIAADFANGQIIVVNSNVDFFFEQGSIATISVDASTPSSPVLLATSITLTPNYAGQIIFDGTSAYIPFRESPSEDNLNQDQIIKYTVASGSLTVATSGTTGKDPFGIALTGSTLLVASNDQLDLLNTDLSTVTSVDLTTAESADIDSSTSEFVEEVVVDTVNNRAFLTNRDDNILVVDLGTNTLTHVINGPQNSRGIAFDGAFIYIVDGNSPALWVFDPSLLPASTATPQEVDDSELLIEVISLGTDPNSITLDTTNQRAYVSNSGDPSISVIDLTLLEEVDRISLDEEDTGLDEIKYPMGMDVGTFNGVAYLFVANLNSNNITIINTETLEIVGVFP